MFKKALFLGVLFLFDISAVQAATEESEDFIWNLQIDIAAVSDPTELVGIKQMDSEDYLQLALFVDIYYKGFFIQSNKNRANSREQGAEIGYQIYEGSNYEVSVLSKSYITGFDEYDIYSGEASDVVVPELSGIDARLDNTMAGVRYLYYSYNSLLSVDVAHEIREGDEKGWLLDTFYVYTHRYKNWDINAGVGATYISDKTNTYFYGVSEHESQSFRPEYSPGSGLIYTFELTAQHPISSSWVFNIGVNVNHYSSSIFDSPLVARDTVTRFKMSVGYVL